MTATNPYHVVKLVSRVPVRIMDETYPFRRDADAWVAEHRSDWGPKYRVIRHDQVEETRSDIRFSHIKQALQANAYQIASDYDDARDRLLKIAAKLEDALRGAVEGPRPGWLKTESGLRHLYDCYFANAERRRVANGSYTPEERDLLRNRNIGWGQTNVVLREAEAEYQHQIRALADASAGSAS